MSAPVIHAPESCAYCGEVLAPTGFVACSGLYVLDIEMESGAGLCGLRVRHDKHLYGETACSCGHVTRYEPYRAAPAQGDWAGVEITEGRLIGPGLASLLVWLRFRLNLSVRRCREFSAELLGLSLSEGAILQASHEAAHACEPIPQQIQEEILQADETSHPRGRSACGCGSWRAPPRPCSSSGIAPRRCCAGASLPSSRAG